MEKLLLTTREAADMLSMGRTKLYEQLDKPGGIPVVRLGRSVRVHVDDVRTFANRQRESDRKQGQAATAQATLPTNVFDTGCESR